MCGVDGCQSMFHHLCQTEWEIYQYHFDYPNGDPWDCVYDSGGKKRCVHHHPHGNFAVNPPLADQSQEEVDRHISEQSHSVVGSVQGDGIHHTKGENVKEDGTHTNKGESDRVDAKGKGNKNNNSKAGVDVDIQCLHRKESKF